MRTELSLPDGYSVREVGGRLYLFDPQGIPLPGPKDPSLIEAYAWRQVWRRIGRELNGELADLRAGIRPLHRLHRLRQYTRMLDAVAQIPREAERRPVTRRVVAWGAFAASAAAIAAVLLMTPLRTTWVDRAPHPVTSRRPAMLFSRYLTPAVAAELGASDTMRVLSTARAVEEPRGAIRDARTWPHRPALAKYAVSFGEFVNRAAADTTMHLIRSKGYIVYVARVGEEFRIVTRPYLTRAQAERLVGALQEIGLPAQLATTRMI